MPTIGPGITVGPGITISSIGLVDVDVLVIGGGGAGGHLGGGGAGGHRYFTGQSLVPNTNYTVTVGAGGLASTGATGNQGSNSVFDTYTSAGGGGGAGEVALPTAGGSGGGGGGIVGSRSGAAGNTPSTSPSQGNAGGNGNDNGAGTAFAGGGGGGAGGTGNNAPGTTTAGDGGVGTANSITGSSVTRAAGGGGGAYQLYGTGTAGTGGSSIGGNGGRNGLNATGGLVNTGSGGGGNGYTSDGNLQGVSGAGGSGVVIIKYSNIFTISNAGGGLTFTTDSSSVPGYKITTFTAGTGVVSFAQQYNLVSGTKAPTLGSSGQNPFPAEGWTALVSTSGDDANISVSLPFTWTYNNTGYTAFFPNSNFYITFGSGSNEYSGLSATVPAVNKIFFAGADNSWQRVSSLTSGTNSTTLRWEGTAGTSGTPGSPNMVYELTFFNPVLTGGVPWLELLVGTQARVGGISGLYSSGAILTGGSFIASNVNVAANQSYVMVGDATGTSWTVYTGYNVSL